MMSEASFASLGPTLLARKGGAKPAMRPQLTPLPEDITSLAALAEEQLEDLGWNDMGADCDPPESSAANAPLLSSKPKPKAQDQSNPWHAGPRDAEDAGDQHPITDPMTSAQVVPLDVHRQPRLAANEDTYDAGTVRAKDREAEIAEEGASPVVRREHKRRGHPVLFGARTPENSGALHAVSSAKKAKRAAFTLRLDTDRHLKLRIAATMQGVSAQSLVTQALDAMLEDIEALDLLVARMKRD